MAAHNDDRFARTQTATGLRALADFLEANPAVPVNPFGRDYSFHVLADDDAKGRAEVDRIAAALGVEVDDDTGRGGHYRATKTFGLMTYRAVYIPARRRAAHRAHMSYADNVVPDDETTRSPAEAA